MDSDGYLAKDWESENTDDETALLLGQKQKHRFTSAFRRWLYG